MQVDLRIESFDSSFRGKYKGYHIDNRLISNPNSTSPIVLKLYKYNQSILNPLSIGFEMFNSIVFINKKIQDIYERRKEIYKNNGMILNSSEMNIDKETVVHVMKRMIDDLIMVLCIHHSHSQILNDKKVEIASIGDLKKHENEKSTIINLIKKELNYDKYKDIFTVINDLHNAYKHSFLINLSHNLLSVEGEALFAYYAKNNRLDDVRYLCHNLIHIVIGFSDFLVEFCDVEVINRQHRILIQKTPNAINFS